jgi:hypothetical protein
MSTKRNAKVRSVETKRSETWEVPVDLVFDGDDLRSADHLAVDGPQKAKAIVTISVQCQTPGSESGVQEIFAAARRELAALLLLGVLALCCACGAEIAPVPAPGDAQSDAPELADASDAGDVATAPDALDAACGLVCLDGGLAFNTCSGALLTCSQSVAKCGPTCEPDQ